MLKVIDKRQYLHCRIHKAESKELSWQNMHQSEKDCIADSALECRTDIYDQIFRSAMLIRKEVNANKSWKSEGTFGIPDGKHGFHGTVQTV